MLVVAVRVVVVRDVAAARDISPRATTMMIMITMRMLSKMLAPCLDMMKAPCLHNPQGLCLLWF